MTRKLLRFEDWPQADCYAWTQATRSPDIFDDPGLGSHWSDGSKKSTLTGYARWLGYCSNRFSDLLALPPEQRVTPDRVKTYIDHLKLEITYGGIFNYVKPLYDAMRVMAPNQDWRWLREVYLRLEKLVVPRNKHPRMVSSHLLVDLGLGLMNKAENLSGNTHMENMERALLYRDGLIIALLASRPIRRRNLAGIRIGINFLADSSGYTLHFGAHETKNHEVLEHPLPHWLSPYICRYLEYYRLMFQNAAHHDGLWASSQGGALCSEAIYDRVAIHTKNAFGHSVNLHLFRDCVATTIADEDPENVQVAADLLGHSSLAITERHYIQKNTSKACASYQNTLADLHQKLQHDKEMRRG